MKRGHLLKLLLAVMFVLTSALTACGGTDNNNEGNNTEEPGNNNDGNGETNDDEEEMSKGDEILSQFNQTVENDGDPIEGGSLTYGIVSDDPLSGVFNSSFYAAAPDFEVIKWFDESLLQVDGDFIYDSENSLASFEHNEDGDVFTFEIEKGVKYHDGEELTVHDWVFAHEVIAHPNYTGPRYDATIENVEGIDEYHEGEADEISGLKVIDDYTLEMTFKEPTPSLLAGGIWTYALPKHIFGDMDPGEIEDSPEVRQNPIGIGPYKVDEIVEGESVTFTKFEDYWRGEPALDELTVKVIAESNVGRALETGEVDMLDSFPEDQYPEYQDLDNIEFIANKENYFSYLGFKLGDWNAEEKRVEMLDDMKMSDPELRKAMAHAIDGDTMGEKFYNGLRWEANSFIDPGHRLYHDPTLEGFEYDLDKANQILDDAGYEYDGDYRTTPDGEELTIHYAAMDRGINEAVAEYFIQQWKEIGLNVELVDGRLLSFNDFYERIGDSGNDDLDIDVFTAAFGTGTNVDPSGLFGREALFNFSRYESDKNDELLADGLSEDAFDLEYRREVYKKWNELMMEEIPAAPLHFRLELTPVNKRVTNHTVDPDIDDMFLYEIGVTEEEPFVSE